ncbi:PEP-CTERM sorting domain-containing protein [Paraglaciecola hydrolytica]|uniref:Ice-binding protein C-terminal domain-containing protein n=1 Tax=Paraglaciecola hydrolytica TaxID=1799789 RepID=A0A136A672_9ALTE|nr:PEP-CTERM sorting domain-containing protein [Paraglaciecola hydrolytica]KXI30711.1 hypothetical protein AX660_04605 [Paraglaciecola hydrolytica]
MKKIICIVSLLFSGIANASLIGSNIDCAQTGGGSNFSCNIATSTVIDPGSEFLVGNSFSYISIDINDFSIDLDFLLNGSLGSTIIVLSGFESSLFTSITSDNLVNVSGITGFDFSDISFGTDSITFNLIDTEFVAGATAKLLLNTVQNVSEPGSIALFGLALAGFFASRRKKA